MKQFNLEEYLKDPSRKVVTRNGKPARIICADAHCEYPVVALIADCDGNESPETYTKYGRSYVDEQTSYDLFFAPKKHEGWMNICKSGNGYTGSIIWPTEEEAKRCAYPGLSAIVKIEWEE